MLVAIKIEKPDASYDRVEWHLYNWADWMRTAGYAGLMLPGRACGGIGISHSADFDQLAGQADRVAAKAIDAIIRDLKPMEHKAIGWGYLGEDWDYRAEPEAVLVVATESVRLGMNRRGIV